MFWQANGLVSTAPRSGRAAGRPGGRLLSGRASIWCRVAGRGNQYPQGCLIALPPTTQRHWLARSTCTHACHARPPQQVGYVPSARVHLIQSSLSAHCLSSTPQSRAPRRLDDMSN